MKKLIVLLIIVFTLNLQAQNEKIFIPLNVQRAIESGTRTITGQPGPNYWQNRSIYEISAEIDVEQSLLIGEESIKYFNNSPDTLSRLVIRLYQDISKIGAVRDRFVGKQILSEGVILNYFYLDNDTMDISTESKDIYRGSTNAIVILRKPLFPNSSVDLKIGWQFEIPQKYKIRMGNYGNGNLYIAYWYPQISVYDDIDGWDIVDYSGTVEFYNDFSDYEVNIKVPKGMVVWATGDLNNAEDVLRNDIYEKYELARKSDQTIKIIEQKDYEKGIVTANNDFNIWNFKAKYVPDFTFATSQTFNWDGTSVIVDPETGRRTLTDVVYEDNTIHYDEAAQYSRATIKYLSEELPGFPYPYSHATSYCNGSHGGGMESPMMANDGAPAERASHIGLIFHEISHNYFPFIMGNNERKYAWMDEGWASFFPREIVDQYEPEYDYWEKRVGSYIEGAGNESDLPLVIPSYSYKTRAVRLGFYDRPSVAYNELKNLLGNDLFKEALLEYVKRWNGKHPIPTDFFFTIDEVAGENLSWFWKPWFYEYGYPDLEITNLKNGDGEVVIDVNKVGTIPTEIAIQFEFEDGTKGTLNKSVSVWKNHESTIQIKLETNKRVKSAVLGNEYIPDVNPSNNLASVK